MNRLKCDFLTLYYTFRFGFPWITISGHDFDEHMVCSRCGIDCE